MKPNCNPREGAVADGPASGSLHRRAIEDGSPPFSLHRPLIGLIGGLLGRNPPAEARKRVGFIGVTAPGRDDEEARGPASQWSGGREENAGCEARPDAGLLLKWQVAAWNWRLLRPFGVRV